MTIAADANLSGPGIADVLLDAPAERLDALHYFYADRLGLLPADRDGVRVGHSRLSWRAGAKAFYHFALLLPAHRLTAAQAWLAERVELLTVEGSPVITFPDWDAQALYFHDPAGSIVEFIAHRDTVGDGTADGPFNPGELLGVSEVGIVVDDKATAVQSLAAEVGLARWSGQGPLDDPRTLAFVGRKAHTLILASPGRGWLPTGRPAEAHPVEVGITGAGVSARVDLGGGAVVRTAAP